MAMKDRMTPVAAAKELGIRPQIVYGFIKHHRINTFNNPEGKTSLVDLTEVKAEVGKVKHHREKDPSTGKPVRRKPPVTQGTLLSTHAHPTGERRARAHKVAVVEQVVLDEEGDPSLIAMRPNGEAATIYWESEALADRIAKGICHIESAESLLAVIMYHWVHNEKPELAAALQTWCEANELTIPVIEEKAA